MAYIVDFLHGLRNFPDEGFSKDERERHEMAWRDVWFHFQACTEIPADELDSLPTRTIVKPIGGFWPDVFPVAAAQVWAVSEPFKATIEELEPGVHNFYPLELVNRKLEPWGKTYFMLHVRRKLENFVDMDLTDGAEWIEETHTLSDGRSMTSRFMRWRGRSTDRLVLKKSAIAGFHLWKGGGGQFTNNHFFSNELADSIQARKLSKLDYRRNADEV